MKIDRNTLLLGGAAVVIALGAGYGIARVTAPPQPAAQGQAHEEGEHEEGGEEAEAAGAEEGFVALTAERARAAGVIPVSLMRGGGQELRLAGRVEPAPSARAVVAAPIGGTVERVLVAPGSPVNAGSALAVVRSAEGAVIRAETSVVRAQADSARAGEQAAAAAFVREERLLREGVVSRQSWEAARATLLQAQAQTRAAAAQARAADARVTASGSPGAGGLATIRSPIAGVVTSVAAAPGGYLAQGAQVAEVSNPRLSELVFNAPAAVAGRIQPGLRLVARGPDSREYPAVVVGIALDAVEASGAAVVRARPTAAVPPAGSPLSASIVVDVTSNGFTVPADAIQQVDGQSVVFVQEARGYRVRPVTPGRTADDRTEILSGLRGDERVAGPGAFLLKAELARGEAEHEH